MKDARLGRLARLGNNTPLAACAYVSLVVLMANVGALTDAVLHPEIPYFDDEHLIAGGVAAGVSAVLFGALLVYVRHLTQALSRIRTLERILPICAHCKKTHRAGDDPGDQASWKPIETYIAEATDTMFSHGICPQCLARYYPDVDQPGP